MIKKILVLILSLVLSASAQVVAHSCSAGSTGSGYSDNFPGTSLSANWAVDTGGFTVASGNVYASTNNSGYASVAHYVGTFSDDQTSQATLSTAPVAYYTGVGVRLSHSGSVCSGYFLNAQSDNNYRIYKFSGTACASTSVVSSGIGVPASGDVMKLAVTGSSPATLQVWINGVSKGTWTDTGPTGGAPGIIGGCNTGCTTHSSVSTWSGQ